MAIINNGILGGISGKIGSIVGAKHFGKNTIRTLPSKSSKTSPAQLICQKKFKNVMTFARSINLNILTRYWISKSMQMSPINKFIKLNYDTFNDDGIPNANTKVCLEYGWCDAPIFDIIIYNSQTGIIQFALEDGEEPGAQPDDNVSILIVDITTGAIINQEDNICERNDGLIEFPITPNLTAENLLLFAWCYRGDIGSYYMQCSDSNARMIN